VGQIRAAAWSIGNRLTVRQLENWPAPLASAPLTVPGADGGFAVLFRFGAVAAVGLTKAATERLLTQVSQLVTGPRTPAPSEEADVVLADGAEEGIDADGRFVLREISLGRAQVVASVLAKSAVLGDYEEQLGSVFERIEPLAADLREGTLPRAGQALLRELGDVLLVQSRMVGRAEIGEKPDLTWDNPELDRLYEKLAVEFELRDREQALTKKLNLISSAASTYLRLLNDRRTLRVEWYIVILILAEIVLFLYEILRGG
jgi:uncharacterized Rmd1/YagE family protein